MRGLPAEQAFRLGIRDIGFVTSHIDLKRPRIAVSFGDAALDRLVRECLVVDDVERLTAEAVLLDAQAIRLREVFGIGVGPTEPGARAVAARLGDAHRILFWRDDE